MGDLFDEWTRDLDGNPVIWNKPPYRSPDGRLRLLMDHEHRDVLHQPGVHQKRIREYYLLLQKENFMMRREQKRPADPDR